MMDTRICLCGCGNIVTRQKWESPEKWERHRFWSRECRNKWSKGKTRYEERNFIDSVSKSEPLSEKEVFITDPEIYKPIPIPTGLEEQIYNRFMKGALR